MSLLKKNPKSNYGNHFNLFSRLESSKKSKFLNGKAQTSMEFVFMVGLSLLLLVPATIVFNRYTSDSQDALINSQVHKLGSELVHLSERLSATGIAWDTIEIVLPGGVKEIRVYNDSEMSELVIFYQAKRLSEVVFFTPIELYNSTTADCTDGCIIDVPYGESELRIESYRNGRVVINSRK